jgi:hypothetical protein
VGYNAALVEELEREIRRQNVWRRLMSVSYFVTSAMAIACSGGATVVAGLGNAAYAAWLAGGATVLYGLEKAMLFREKWHHHLTTAAQLEALRFGYVYGQVNDEQASARIGAVLTEYAVKLPMSPREQERETDATE